MKKDMVITIDNNVKYYLSDEAVHENKRYFLAIQLDKEEDPSEHSFIVEEIKEGDKVRVEPVTDEKTYNYLAAVFTSNFISLVEETPDEYDDQEEEVEGE